MSELFGLEFLRLSDEHINSFAELHGILVVAELARACVHWSLRDQDDFRSCSD